MSDRIELLAWSSTRIAAAARQRLPRGHGVAALIYRDAHRRGRFEPERHGLSDAAAEAWRAHFALTLPEPLRSVAEPHRRPAAAATVKAVLRCADGLEVETVRLGLGDDRESQCLSSQVGCAMGCRFCETARIGLRRDLTPAEIVAQVVIGRAGFGWRPSRLVFQGMGEPLDAVDPILDAIDVLGDRQGLGFARERITVCTAGHIDGLQRLAARGIGRLNLSVSLNAADDRQRAELMPIARRWPLAELRRTLVALRPRRNWQLGVHWCLVPGWNDRPSDIARIADFVAPLGRVMLHLIPYNPGSRPIGRAPSEAEIATFAAGLRSAGLAVRARVTKGRGVMAGCGQLGNVALRRRARIDRALPSTG